VSAVATDAPRTEARFPSVERRRGHYESFYLRACHPAEPLGVWIRYTVDKEPGEAPRGSLWFTLFDRPAGGPRASKVTLPDPAAGDGDYIRVGDSHFRPGEVVGSTPDASWELRFEEGEEPLHHLPRDWMYRARIPRTKLLTPHPTAAYSGAVEVDGRRIELDRWPGMAGHNWGAEHAERWIWLHGIRFEGRDDAWLDMSFGRIKLGPLTTPWIGNGVLSIDGRRHRLGGPGRARSTHVAESPTRVELAVRGGRVMVSGSAGAESKDFVGWIYADPGDGEHNTVNCSIAWMELRVERDGAAPLELRTDHGAAYELGMRETDHGIPIQPYR